MGLFAIREYRRLFGAQVIALFGTGLATVALGLLAYELAGPAAGTVLATALTIKMVMYVVIAPIAAAWADRLPRRLFLTLLDVIRAGVVVALPFITEIWQIYVLIGVLQAASAAFTPTFQAVIPDIVTDESQYTRALSASQVAYTMESLLSPVLAALALLVMSFDWLFAGTALGFAVSAALVLATRIPNATPSGRVGARDRLSSGLVSFARTPRLRGIMALNLVVAAAGSIVVVNTVNYVRDRLGGGQADVAWMLAASGGGTLLVALALPRVLDRVSDRAVMLSGAAALVAGLAAAVAMAATATESVPLTASIWVAIGAGMALIVTPTGRVIRSSIAREGLPAAFAAQFSLSHLAWLITYPIAGWLGASSLAVAWVALGALAMGGTVAALLLWPREPAAAPAGGADAEAVEAECVAVAGQNGCVHAV
ncbi:MFS transporter [Agromyces mediolanus]|uniref:MFS transporter n=1 Tax=Agromyces mediolanus TaxID=41986 RepID=A0A918CER7_AGRME|nr:MFS transporter [Agromyces mediolanus]GGR18248.1 MFS transporter [Agromyces mediolanus]GLJ71471.1 MFS transporter [Agromyces mediolanus]